MLNKVKLTKCIKCEKKTKLIIKLGGLICANCRIILFYPDDKEYLERIKLNKKEHT